MITFLTASAKDPQVSQAWRYTAQIFGDIVSGKLSEGVLHTFAYVAGSASGHQIFYVVPAAIGSGNNVVALQDGLGRLSTAVLTCETIPTKHQEAVAWADAHRSPV